MRSFGAEGSAINSASMRGTLTICSVLLVGFLWAWGYLAGSATVISSLRRT